MQIEEITRGSDASPVTRQDSLAILALRFQKHPWVRRVQLGRSVIQDYESTLAVPFRPIRWVFQRGGDVQCRHQSLNLEGQEGQVEVPAAARSLRSSPRATLSKQRWPPPRPLVSLIAYAAANMGCH